MKIQEEEKGSLTVFNPRGNPPPIQLLPMAPRLDSLDGKTVYIVDIRFSGGYSFLHEMIDWFAKNMPKVNTVFKEKNGNYFEDDPALWAEIKEHGDAMIMAIGH